MDETKYVELEAKYDASMLPVSDFQAAMNLLGGTSKVVVGLDTFFSNGKKVLRYRRARPLMPFHRSDKSELTYKQRRRTGDISDRTEVNLPLAAEASEQDVRAHLEVMDMREHFTITKESWIQHVPGCIPGSVTLSSQSIVGVPGTGQGLVAYGGGGFYGGATGVIGGGLYGPYQPQWPPPPLAVPPVKAGDGIDAVFALYDVLHEGKIRRFLEVEMERKNQGLTAEAAQVRLTQWKDWIAQMWPQLGQPLNTSLYEMFAPLDELFVPESF